MMTTETEQQLSPLPTLSHLLREGAKLHPQCFGTYCHKQEDGTLSTCALGAIYEAINGTISPEISWIGRDLAQALDLTGKTIFHPQIKSVEPVIVTISELNDGGWTRERIATYLEEQGY